MTFRIFEPRTSNIELLEYEDYLLKYYRYLYCRGCCVVFVVSYFHPALFRIAGLILLLLALAIVADALLIFGKKQGLFAKRITTERFSIGDPNKVVLHLHNNYPFPVRISTIDELPVQFQERDWIRKTRIDSGAHYDIEYYLQPLTRGEYVFENINVFAHGPLQLVKRRYIFPACQTVKVYPSYIQMRRYQLLAVATDYRKPV